jgi:hypothetical protein
MFVVESDMCLTERCLQLITITRKILACLEFFSCSLVTRTYLFPKFTNTSFYSSVLLEM